MRSLVPCPGADLISLRWAANRLRRMSAAEVLWRARKALKARLEKNGIGLAPGTPPKLCTWGLPWQSELGASPDGAIDPLPYRQAAERVLAGQFDVFALRGAALGFPPRWNRDPKTGIDAALAFGKTLNYRDPAAVGDIKYLWEPNRHYELVTLAQAFHLTHEDKYAGACRELLESWFEQCPYPLGQAWSSSLENAIRLTNWAVAWHFLGGNQASIFEGAQAAQFRHRWMTSIHQHCHFIAGHFSRHSSANNHLLGECMGLFIGATTWPCWSESRSWQQRAHDEFERQALRQNGADGVNREQAFWYQHEVADMMLLCGLVGRANGITFADAYWKRLTAMLTFIAAVMDKDGHVPMIGDSDDAVMVRLSQEADFHPYRSLLASGAVLFRRQDFKRRAQRFDHKSHWLLGQAGAEIFKALTPSAESADGQATCRSFPLGGYYLLGNALDTDQEIRVLADAGPLGYLSIAAHGHADALALTLSAAGQPLLIDPGTYAYHTEEKWRRYFRGTAAHNTVRVDACDQSVQGGNFMWLRQANAQCEHWQADDRYDCFIGSHDGYLRLSDPVRHRRKIVLDKRASQLVVEDSLECHATHDIEWHWHLAAGCEVAIDADSVLVSCGNVKMTITMPQSPAVPGVAFGQEEPPLGWVSYRFDEKQPSPTLVWRERILGTVHRTTVFDLVLPAPQL